MCRAIVTALVLCMTCFVGCAHNMADLGMADSALYVVVHRARKMGYPFRGSVGVFDETKYLTDIRQGECLIFEGAGKRKLLLDSGSSLTLDIEFSSRGTVNIYNVESVAVDGRLVPDIKKTQEQVVKRADLSVYLDNCFTIQKKRLD